MGTGVGEKTLPRVDIRPPTRGGPPPPIPRGPAPPGHDRRYSLDIRKITALGWEPAHTPEEAIIETARWYRDNEWWWRKTKSGEFQQYYEAQYGERLRTAAPLN